MTHCCEECGLFCFVLFLVRSIQGTRICLVQAKGQPGFPQMIPRHFCSLRRPFYQTLRQSTVCSTSASKDSPPESYAVLRPHFFHFFLSCSLLSYRLYLPTDANLSGEKVTCQPQGAVSEMTAALWKPLKTSSEICAWTTNTT